jgi:hypothetical protein
MTTAFGILQFSKFSEPDPESGYTLDDNARALINMVMYHKFKPNEETLISAYLPKIYIGIQRPNGWFDNYKDYDNELTAQNYGISKMLMEELYGAWDDLSA